MTGLLAALSVAAYFAYFAGPGLRAGFTGDDLMNLYGAWSHPFARHVADSVLFFRTSPTYRPAGSLFYRLLFEAFGLNPLPYRVACYALLLVNLWLSYQLVRRLTGSPTAASLAALLHSYHLYFDGYYRNTGVCYDLICFFFYAPAFLYYLRIRGQARWPQLLAWSALYVLCLDSKEMAVTLPVMMGIHELLVNPPKSWRPRGLSGWIWNENRVALAGAGMTIAFLAGRLAGPGALTAMSTYRPVFRLGVLVDRLYRYFSFALYEPRWLTPRAAGCLIALLAAAAIWSRLAGLRFGLAWMLIGILPVALIPMRGFEAAYIPALGLATYLGAGIAWLTRADRSRLRTAAVFTSLLLALFLWNRRYGRIDFATALQPGLRTQAIYRQLARVAPPLKRNANVLFIRDPFPDDEWQSSFLVHLYSNSGPLFVERLDRLLRQPNRSRLISFDLVLSYENERLAACDTRPFRNVAVSELETRACVAGSGVHGAGTGAGGKIE